MEQPNVVNTLKDPAAEVTYNVLAYRALTRQELLQAVAMYRQQTRKKPKRGTVVSISTIIGLSG